MWISGSPDDTKSASQVKGNEFLRRVLCGHRQLACYYDVFKTG